MGSKDKPQEGQVERDPKGYRVYGPITRKVIENQKSGVTDCRDDHR